MAEPIIQLDHINKKYLHNKTEAVIALNDVNLTIAKGEIFGIIGASGAGKSTLLRSINRLETPQSGNVFIGKTNISELQGKNLRAERRKIGMIFQHFNLLSSRTVFDNIAFPLEIAGISHNEIRQRVSELIDLVDLKDKTANYPYQLSGGQKQRVGIARALANRPEILLCDEATSALDPQTTKAILRLLQDVNRRLGITIVLITHEIAVIKEICDSVAVLEKGRIIESGPVIRVFSSPHAETTRKLIRTAFHGELPLQVRQKMASRPDARNRKQVHISFVGDVAEEPLISRVIRDFQVDVNILYANLDFIQDTPFGSLFVELTGEAENIGQALDFLTKHGLGIEVITDVESPDLATAH